ncbi:MAG: twin-arginine translocation signal domain-containing protein, partial [Pseudomonadales bacterium]
MDRRAFLKGTTLAGLAAPMLLSQVHQAVAAVSGKSAEALAPIFQGDHEVIA